MQGAFRGRAYACEFLCMTLTFAAGGLLTGALYDATGSIETTVWSLCAALAVSATVWWRLVRGVPRREPQGA